MLARQVNCVKSLIGIALGLVVLAVGLWAVPAFGDTSDALEDQSLSVFVNIPVNEIQDGQFCQGYANVSGGTPPYTFTWSGQFTNADGQTGPQGEDQIVNGFISSARPDSLRVDVWDDNDEHDFHRVFLTIGTEYNEHCEAR